LLFEKRGLRQLKDLVELNFYSPLVRFAQYICLKALGHLLLHRKVSYRQLITQNVYLLLEAFDLTNHFFKGFFEREHFLNVYLRIVYHDIALGFLLLPLNFLQSVLGNEPHEGLAVNLSDDFMIHSLGF
jgi:hypothetical protein